MKLSNETIDILKNFSEINSSLFVSEGSTIKTRSAASNIHCEATIEESFPQGFGVYDLQTFISMLTLFNDPEIEFEDNFLTISKDDNSFKFFYSSEELIKEVTSNIPEYESLFEFQLVANDIKTIKKTAGITKAKTISFIGDGENVIISIGDHTNDTKNTFHRKLGESSNKFSIHLDYTVFKVIDDDYTVNISSRKFVHMASTSKTLDYILASLQSSTVN